MYLQDVAQTGPESWPSDPGKALEEMLAQYGTAVLRLAFYYLGDPHYAEDASQEAFLRAYRGWGAFTPTAGGTVKAWLMKITANVCRDELRRRKSKKEESLTEGAFYPRSSDEGPEEVAIARVQKSIVLKHLRGLPEDIRQTVFLFYYFDLNTVEIAHVLGCPEGTVRSRLTRARKRLKDALEGGGWS